MAARDDPLRDGGDLVGRLAQSEDDFGKALPYGAVGVDPGEAQVFERRRSSAFRIVRRGSRDSTAPLATASSSAGVRISHKA